MVYWAVATAQASPVSFLKKQNVRLHVDLLNMKNCTWTRSPWICMHIKVWLQYGNQVIELLQNLKLEV